MAPAVVQLQRITSTLEKPHLSSTESISLKEFLFWPGFKNFHTKEAASSTWGRKGRGEKFVRNKSVCSNGLLVLFEWQCIGDRSMFTKDSLTSSFHWNFNRKFERVGKKSNKIIFRPIVKRPSEGRRVEGFQFKPKNEWNFFPQKKFGLNSRMDFNQLFGSVRWLELSIAACGCWILAKNRVKRQQCLLLRADYNNFF